MQVATVAVDNMRNNTGSPASADGPPPTLTIRIIMQGKEVGSIIGKKGDNIKKFREESGAKINISDGSVPERIVTVTGHTEAIYKAFSMISKKLEEDILNGPNSNVPKPPVTLRLIVPASQCGSLIGKGGCKIKEIREVTGASIQVASEMLPNSTERAVTVSGTADAITQCVYHICCVMLESPPKGATIPYRPKPAAVAPVIFPGAQIPYPVATHIPVPTVPQDIKFSHIQHIGQVSPLLGGAQPLHGGTFPTTLLAAHAAQGQFPRHATPLPNSVPAQQTHEMTIPNELIGCIIGRGGSKINEIRHLSGAAIKIANQEDGSVDRTVTITGSLESVNMAQYLINASIELFKATNADPVVAVSTPATSIATAAAATPLGGIPLALKPSPVQIIGGVGYYEVAAATPKLLTTKIRPNFIPLSNGVKKFEPNKFMPY